MKTTLFIILAIVQVVLVMIPLFGKLYTETSGANSYKITLYGKLILIVSIVGLLVTLGLYLSSENDDEESKKKLSSQLALRDSLNQLHLDSVQKKTYLNTIELLAKYGYKADSTTNMLVKIIKDSSRTKIITGPDPIVGIMGVDDVKGIRIEKKENGMIAFQYHIASADAGSCSFELSASFIGQLPSDTLKYFRKAEPMNNTSQIPRNKAFTAFFNVSEEFNLTFLFIWLRGKYKNIDKSKTFSMDELYYYNIKGNTNGSLDGETRNRIIKEILKNEK